MMNKNETKFQRYFHMLFKRTNIKRNSNVIKKRNYMEQINNVIVT